MIRILPLQRHFEMLKYNQYFSYYGKLKPMRNAAAMKLHSTIDIFEKCPYISRGEIADIQANNVGVFVLSGTRLIIFDAQFQVVKVVNETIFVNAYANEAVLI